jgi:hypothetical protein
MKRYEQEIDAAVGRWDLARAKQLADNYLAAAPSFQSMYLAGQVALLTGRFRRSAELLAPLVPEASRHKKVLGPRLRLLLAEAHARAGEAEEARRLLAGVPAAPLEKDLGLRLRALRVRLRVEGAPPEEVAACAADLAKHRERENEALLWCDAGCARDRAGDLAGAEEHWRRAEQRGRGAGVRPARADALLQLGRLEHLRGRLSSALDCYAPVAGCGLPGQLKEAQLRRLLVLVELDRRSAARAEAEELLPAGAVGTLPEVLQPLGRLVRGVLDGTGLEGLGKEAEGYEEAMKGRVAEARRLYIEALAVEAAPERRARRCLALGLLEGGAEGEDWLREAERLGRKFDLSGVLARALVARGQRMAACGRDEEARIPLEEAVALSEGEGPSMTFRQTVLRYLLEAACRRGDAAAVLKYQERERGRLLLEWLAHEPGRGDTALFDRPDWAVLARELAHCEAALRGARGEARRALLRTHAALLASRDVLFERHLLERERRATGLLPRLLAARDLARRLPAGSVYVAPVVTREGVYLLCARRGEGTWLVYKPGYAGEVEVEDAAAAVRVEIESQMDRYHRGQPGDRARLDGLLGQVGEGPLGRALREVLRGREVRRLVWAPDAVLHGLPVHAVRLEGGYLIERVEVVWAFSASLLVQQLRTRRQARGTWRPVVAVADARDLPQAQEEAEGVAAVFLRGRCPTVEGSGRRQLRRWLARCWLAHFACHAKFDARRPLAARLLLPSGEAIHALEWLEEPVRGVRLVTLSACRAAQVGPVAGGEVFGLVGGLLGGGARAVVAGLWLLADEETPPFMWSFYRHLLREPLPTALARAQREALSDPEGSPLFWAAFALFGDPEAIRPPPFPWRWLASWRQRHHARRYPGPGG